MQNTHQTFPIGKPRRVVVRLDIYITFHLIHPVHDRIRAAVPLVTENNRTSNFGLHIYPNNVLYIIYYIIYYCIWYHQKLSYHNFAKDTCYHVPDALWLFRHIVKRPKLLSKIVEVSVVAGQIQIFGARLRMETLSKRKLSVRDEP
jgi:hypothetical protein